MVNAALKMQFYNQMKTQKTTSHIGNFFSVYLCASFLYFRHKDNQLALIVTHMNFKQTGDVSLNQRKNVSRFVAEMSLQLRNSKTLKSTKEVSQENDLCFNRISFSFPIIKLISTIFHFVANEMNTFFYYSNQMDFEKNRVETFIILKILFYIFFYDISNVSQNKKYFYLSFLFSPQKFKSRMELICWHHLKQRECIKLRDNKYFEKRVFAIYYIFALMENLFSNFLQLFLFSKNVK